MAIQIDPEMGVPGTATYRRMWEMRGLSQKAMGRACLPKMAQPHISQFERGQRRLSWKMAKRLAPAYYPEEWNNNQHFAQILIWRLWFNNVAAYGTAEMKRIASDLKKTVERDVYTAQEDMPLLAGIVNDKPAEIIPMPFAAQKKAGQA